MKQIGSVVRLEYAIDDGNFERRLNKHAIGWVITVYYDFDATVGPARVPK